MAQFYKELKELRLSKEISLEDVRLTSEKLPDRFIDHDKPELMYKYAGLDADSIETKILDTLNSKVVVKKSN